MSYLTIFGYNHEWDCYKLLGAETGRIIFARRHMALPRGTLNPPVNPDRSPPTALYEDIYLHVCVNRHRSSADSCTDSRTRADTEIGSYTCSRAVARITDYAAIASPVVETRGSDTPKS